MAVVDSQFAPSPRYTDSLAPLGGVARDRADLLTTVMHEMDHLFGYKQAADDLVHSVLPLGVRRDFAG